MFGILYKFYANIKTIVIDYFYRKNEPELLNNISEEDIIKINNLKKEINHMELTINIDSTYKCLKNLDKNFSKNSNIDEIIDFLTTEEKMLYSNKDNLSLSVESIQKNTYVINLKQQFLKIKEIQNKKELIEKIKK